MEKYLPIGTVVLLHEGQKTVMIFGRQQIHAETDAVYDYVACLYPEGNIDVEHTYLFNHEQIREVVYMGYVNDDEKDFLLFIEEKSKRLMDDENVYSE